MTKPAAHTAATNRAIAAQVFRFYSPAYLTAQVESIAAASMKSDAWEVAKAAGGKPGGTPVGHISNPGSTGSTGKHRPTAKSLFLRAQITAAISAGNHTTAEIMAATNMSREDWKSQSVAMIKKGQITAPGQNGRSIGRYALVTT